MTNKLPLHLLFFFVIIISFASCKTSKNTQSSDNKNLQKRYYYDFSKLKLQNTLADTNPIPRPVPYPAFKDIQIEIFNYNPLRDEIIVEDSSSERFLSDTDKFSKYITFPKVSDLVTGQAKPGTVAGKDSTMEFLKQDDKKIKIIKKTGCDSLKDKMVEFNSIKSKIEEAISEYQKLLTKIEIINDDYEYLKSLIVLKPSDISTRLNGSFLARLNSFTGSSSALNRDPSLTSSGDITNLEEKYNNDVIDFEKKLGEIKDEVDELKSNCAEYVELYKKFNNSFNKLRDGLKEFRISRTNEILPRMTKTMRTYDKLKVYLTEVPNFVTKAIPIIKDQHTITIYKKEIGKENKVIYDYINIEPTRGFKVDVAGGFFFSGLKDDNFTKKSMDSIYTKKYLVDGTIRDTTVQESFTSIYEKKQSNISFGGMLFLHAHSQNACWFNYGVYLGFGALFNDQTRWAGAFGGSLLFGKNQRFSINPGAIVAQVERLSPPYKTETWYRETIDNIATYKAWKIKFALGFSWNLR
jgi:regulator of replication initiation timing